MSGTNVGIATRKDIQGISFIKGERRGDSMLGALELKPSLQMPHPGYFRHTTLSRGSGWSVTPHLGWQEEPCCLLLFDQEKVAGSFPGDAPTSVPPPLGSTLLRIAIQVTAKMAGSQH